MFNVGGGELIVIVILALIVLGPERLPGALRTGGRWMAEIRRMSSGFQTDFRSALAEAERDAERARAQADANAAAPMAPIEAPAPPAADAPAAADTPEPADPEGSPEPRTTDDTPPPTT